VTRPLRLAALAWPVGREAFAGALDRWCAEARAAGAELLLLPEYAPCAAAFAKPGGASAEGDAAAAAAPALVAAMEDAASRHGLWLAGGTVLRRTAQGIVNACPLVSPEGLIGWQDKHRRTRFEREAWSLAPGAPPSVFETPWGRLGIAVCYDVEFPPLVRAQVLAGAWLMLAPAATDTPAGASRITVSARARAIENQCFVAVAPTVGAAPWSESLDANHGRAGIYGPADRGFADDGIVVQGVADAPGLVVATLDRARIEAVRRDGAVLNHADWPDAVPPCRVVSREPKAA
jgi:predicted amidohydrolase